MLSKFLISAALITAALGSAGLTAYYLYASRPAAEKSDAVRPLLRVRGERVRPENVTESLVGYGAARAAQRATISAEIAGQVVFVSDRLEEGLPVAAGQVLLRVDDRDYQAQLEQANAAKRSAVAERRRIDVDAASLLQQREIAQTELDIARDELTRVKDLFERGQAGERELDAARAATQQAMRALAELSRAVDSIPERRAAAEAAVAQAEAQAALASNALSRTTIRAPFDGVIESEMVELGEIVAPGAQLFTMVDTRRIEVFVELPMSWYPRLRVGAAATISTEVNQGDTWVGEVARISPSGSMMSRTLPVYIEVDNREQDTPLKPGLFVRAAIDGRQFVDAATTPRGAVQDGVVFVEQPDHTVGERAVEVVATLGERAVVSGLAFDDVVITSNLDSLVVGAPVHVELTNEPASANRDRQDDAATPSAQQLAIDESAREPTETQP